MIVGCLERTGAAIIGCMLLIGLPIANGQSQSLCDKADLTSAVMGNKLCIVVETFNAKPTGEVTPVLAIMLHGDVSRGGPASYHVARMQQLAEGANIPTVAMIRPGYEIRSGRKSEGTHYKRRDSYTQTNNRAMGAAIKKLKTFHKARKVVLIGHSGGAAMAGVIIDTYPGLIDKAVLASCPCDIKAWRRNSGYSPFIRSQSPSKHIRNIERSTQVVAITGSEDRNTTPDLAIDYVWQLKARGIQAEAIIVQGASHSFNARLWHPVFREVTRFVEQHR